jgi:CRP/FNR family transcriptional regulator
MICYAPDAGQEVFTGLAETSRAKLQSFSQSISCQKGDLIFQEGEVPPGLYHIRRGIVKYGKFCVNHQQQRLLKILGPGDLLGTEIFFGRPGCGCPGFARALSDAVQLDFLEREPLLAFLLDHPQILLQLCQRMAEEVIIFECKLTELAYAPMVKNLSRLLLILAQRFGQPEADGHHLPSGLGRIDLAELTGTHPDTMSRLLHELQEKGAIRVHGHELLITYIARLRELAGPETSCVEYSLF